MNRLPSTPRILLSAFLVLGSAFLLLFTIVTQAAQTTPTLSSIQRLERKHLQATHEAREAFARDRRALPLHGLYEDFPSVMHVHAEDAEHTKGTRAELLAGARKAGIRVVLMTEHRGPKPDAWRGLHDRVLFIAGSEVGDGTLWYPDYDTAGKFIAGSGLRFLSHVEERYDASMDGMVGLEICNRHSDAILDKGPELYLGTATLSSNAWRSVVNDFQSFPDEFFGAGSDYRSGILAKWDKELETTHLTGIGANDAHQNVIIKGVTFDPYEVSFRNLVTHILARELTEPSIRQALTNGHVYVSHDWLCDPAGFTFGAVNNLGVFTMGDTAPMAGKTRLTALSPLPARLKLLHNGAVLKETTGTNLTFEAKEPGSYRLEAWLTIDGEDRPWIYSNPVYLRSLGLADFKLPSAEISPSVHAQKNVPYLENSPEDKHKLDIYSPSDQTNCPVIFFVHGGAWKTGDRSYYPPLGNRYALEGFVTVVPSYRLAPKHPHPAQIEDVAAAFAWTVAHVREYGGDTNRIFVAGHSAGAHLAALLSLDHTYLAAQHLSPSSIRGVLAWSGVYDLTNGEGQEAVFGKDHLVRQQASPLSHVKAGGSPFFVSYCEWDYFSLPGQARAFSHALSAAGVPSQLLFIPAENHLSEMLNIASADDPLVKAALAFMSANQFGGNTADPQKPSRRASP
jgi:acetyl esterase/lipase